MLLNTKNYHIFQQLFFYLYIVSCFSYIFNLKIINFSCQFVTEM